MKRVQIVIKSDLRNSGFGFAVLHRARKTGISGFVKYAAEGFPVINAQGDNQQVDRFIQWCRESRTCTECQAEAEPLQVLHIIGGDPENFFEHLLLVSFFDPDAPVGDRYEQFIP